VLRPNRNDNQPAYGDIPPTQAHESVPAAAESAAKEKTVIGEQISVEGTIRAKEDLLIQGKMKGSIEMAQNKLTVGAKGSVEADVNALDVTVSGTMNGNIDCHNRVEITREADFTGQIKAKRISIEDGAYVKATIELQREGDAKSKAAAVKPAEQSQQSRDAKPQGTNSVVQATVISGQPK
jgi:cytoskeletal protein CcmA (bactofilin family)